MKYSYTVEHPKGLTRIGLRRAIKTRLILKRKLGFLPHEAVTDAQLGLKPTS